MTNTDAATKAINSMNRNQLSSLIDEASRKLVNMDNEAIEVMENAQLHMQENKSHHFPRACLDDLKRVWLFDGDYKQMHVAIMALVKHPTIKYATAAFAESTAVAITSEYKHILRLLYCCTGEPASPEWDEAKKRFWNEFDSKYKSLARN